MKKCIACGMPMKQPYDHAMGDESKEYCKNCCREDGSMQSYDEKLLSLTALIAASGVNEEIARSVAIAALAKLPIWKGQRPSN